MKNTIRNITIIAHVDHGKTTLIEKIEKFGKSFNQLTVETVKAFLIDSKKSNFKL